MEKLKNYGIIVSLISVQCVNKVLKITFIVQDDESYTDLIDIKKKYEDPAFLKLESMSDLVAKCAFFEFEKEDTDDYELDECLRDIEVK